ncbi:iron deficiency-induced protein A [Paenibacillus darwinianus]|uniref:Fe(3+) ABC transporter substrate-binding protein n=1 Tax=Paenibacillus darwinianus TaxID=1380763 RepID=UPI00044D53F0|nr:Fe(3+) ABC transporter substrate-binding protein [Paenibacillus darwinianus]EXX85296.1 iron deficiency-induced protein A [Paenibacillus darwinianus]
MRKFKVITLLLTAVLSIGLLAACGSSGASNTGKTNADTSAANDKTKDNASKENTSGQASGEQVVNVYTARNYDVDKVLFGQFTEKTGIKVNVVEGKAEELIERIKREGESTPADLFITVDGGVLNNAKLAGVLQPVQSDVIDAQVPMDLRDTGNEWIGLSTRARIIAYAKDRVKPEQLSTYEDLATEKWKGKVLVRSSTNLYNQSLLASFIAIDGEQKAEQWAQGIANNLARDPDGGDRDQAKAIVAGTGDVAIMNTYYVGQMTVSDDPEEVKVSEQIGVFFPNQETTGTHRNISGAGLIKYSKNKDNAVKLIEFLTGKEAQTLMSAENFEFPVNGEAALPELLASWGTFKTQDLDFAKLGEYNKTAVEIMNKVGWK